MSALGLIATGLAIACTGVLVHDLWRRRTAFAQFAAGRSAHPGLFKLGIAAWCACLLGSSIVVVEELGREACEGADPCTVTIRIPQQ